ncbi:nucleotidyltransferase domain-containing protein [Candidatus Woesearchaeota archaeon]|nr:nucleotidyltransferase domain-containing protein [Candidatus Woesearchaeota archaeon]
MLTKPQVEILNLFRKNIFLKASILQIQKQLKKKSYQRVYDGIQELGQIKALKIEKFGHSNLITLPLNYESVFILSYLDEDEAFSHKVPNIHKLLDIKELADDIVMVIGSYAKNKQTKSSDIDLIVITTEKAFDKQKLIENLTLTFFPPIHPIVLTRKDFIDMLISAEENLGKEAFKNHLLYRNPKGYYELVKEAAKHGFAG